MSLSFARWRLYLDLIRWDRPAGWLLLLWPTLSALWLAADGFPGWHLLFVFIGGTILMRSAGCCINDVADREFDRHVARTAKRPVTTGAIPVKEALQLGALLAVLAFLLVLSTNPPTIWLSLPALAVALLYPYAKRVLAMPQAVLGVAFSFGIPMAFSAVLGADDWRLQAIPDAIPLAAWGLMAANLFWVLAYDTEYAMVDREDDLKIGIKTSAITLGAWDVRGIALFYLVFLGGWAGLALSFFGMGWGFVAGWGLALAQVLWHLRLIAPRERAGCFQAFRLNHWVGAALFAGTALDLML
ncbi:4-hydroxybenzoate polyprenyltransferase [Inhella inkyongensis]|uniref:4-hydroxybenzoate octaprenyltransferase n=1 Tax=Inhella inkyongensis TaxID=392593 RepID=A0A840SBI4_9BURK|nr:4-hydroxybenzoate octaprenyltransferase [Inhella inkyongensis]MBB5205710.1 4-hydroxybenzoate polyprenyltransferase [Inhella inkyongensis]